MIAPVVVGIPTLVRYDLLDEAIARVLTGTRTPSRVLVVDNGGSYVAKDPRVEIIRPNQNLGVSASWNLICKLAEPADVLLLNDDFHVGPRTLERMWAAPGPFITIAGSWSCILMRDGAWQQVGPFDEDFYPAYYEDNDHHWRMRLCGYDVVRLPIEDETHYTSSTIHALTEEARQRLAGRLAKPSSGGGAYYASKWGGPPGEEKFKVPFNRDREWDPLTVRFLSCCNEPSDINEHLPKLYSLARDCDHVTELGMGHGRSTTAFLAASPRKLISVDIKVHPEVWLLQALATRTQFQFVQGDSTQVDIEPTDLLFIDTHHVYEQLSSELRLHAGSARRWIILHDTTTFGIAGADGGRGIWPAVEELVAQGEWRIEYKVEFNNGLTVLERRR